MPRIGQDYLYNLHHKCLCHLMHLRPSQFSFCDTHVHLYHPHKFCSVDINKIIYPQPFKFIISNFINPPYHNIDYYLNMPKVFGTIGIHPPQANSAMQRIRTVEHLISHHKIIAIGECGLDATKKHSLSSQEGAFTDQIILANHRNVLLVIHCQDMQHQTFNIAKQHLNHQHPIHLQCFTGTNDDVNMWSGYFINIDLDSQTRSHSWTKHRLIRSTPEHNTISLLNNYLFHKCCWRQSIFSTYGWVFTSRRNSECGKMDSWSEEHHDIWTMSNAKNTYWLW